MDAIVENFDIVVQGYADTLALFVIAGIGSLLFGTLLASMRVGPIRVLNRAAGLYVTLVRNTPLLVILIFMRKAGPKVGISFNFVDLQIGELRINNLFTACVVGLIIYTSAFVCEAIRSGVNAVPLGQAEAARAIGLPFSGSMRHVVLPQAFRATVPPLASVQIALLKNTTVAGALGVLEAFVRLRGLLNDYPTDRIVLFLFFAFVFVVLVEIVSFFAHRLERRWRVAA